MEAGKNRFNLIKKIVEGTYGQIFYAYDKEKLASIAIKKQTFEKKEGMSGIVLRELDVMSRIHHNNIMSIREIRCFNQSVWTFMDWYSQNLYEWISANNWATVKRSLRCILHQLLQAVRSMHACGILHYDLKPENIMMQNVQNSAEFPEGLKIVVTDFGLCNPHGEVDIKELCTVNYRPPELLCRKDGGEQSLSPYGPWVDIWSVGCIVAEMINRGERFFSGMNEQTVMHSIFSTLGVPNKTLQNDLGMNNVYLKQNFNYQNFIGIRRSLEKIRDDLPNELLIITEAMLHIDFRKRPSAADVLGHNYFSPRSSIKTLLRYEHRVKTHSYKNNYRLFKDITVRKNTCHWMYSLTELYSMPHRSCFTAIQLMDRYLYRCYKLGSDIQLDERKLKEIALASLNLSFTYYNHLNSPLSSELVEYTKTTDLDSLLNTCISILTILKWKIGFVTLYDSAIAHNSDNMKHDQKLYHLALLEKVCKFESLDRNHADMLKEIDDVYLKRESKMQF